jgi:thiamine-phosphate pyrophosphorylase
VIRCAITNGTAAADEAKWLAGVARILDRGAELLQIRERDLSARHLAELTRKVLALHNPHETKILVNDRADVAMACGAHGVHLRDGSVKPEKFARPGFMVTVACHDTGALKDAAGAAFILLAPVFRPLSKADPRPALGLGVLNAASRISPARILALGGITKENAPACVAAGAAGIAGIAFFENGD